MKKIFFLLGSMNVGGVEKAFLNLVSELPKDKYEIHLGLLKPRGGFMEDTPSHVTIHHINSYEKCWDVINNPPLKTIKGLFNSKQYIPALVHLFLYIINRTTRNYYLLYKYLLRKEPFFETKFDIAIAFAGPSQMIDYYICEKVDAKVKYGWIHFDVTKFGIDRGMTNKLYRKYNKIFVVSENAKEKFDLLFPKLRHKTQVFYNVVSRKLILEQSNNGVSFSDSFDGYKILTVGRISPEKGQDIAINALKIILDKGYNVKWYFVGDGKLKADCIQESKQLGISDNVVFLGTKINPYPYMKDCNVYVQTSRHEGFCITLAEALCFNNPIVSTDFISATELLSNRTNSFVTTTDANDLANGVIKALSLSDSTQESTDSISKFNSDINLLFD